MAGKMTLYKIVVLGDGGVGKTALVINFCLNHFVETYDPTIEDSYRKQIAVDRQTCMIEVLDTAGQEEYKTLRDQWIRDGEAFVLVYSISSRSSFTRIQRFYHQVQRVKESANGNDGDDANPATPPLMFAPREHRHPPPVILVGNKSDKVLEREVSLQEGFALARELGCEFIECSAKNALNIEKVFYDAIRLLRRIRQEPLRAIQSPKDYRHRRRDSALTLVNSSRDSRLRSSQSSRSLSVVWRQFLRKDSSLDQKPNSNPPDPTKPLNRQLLDASRAGDEKLVKKLLRQGADPTEYYSPDGCAIHSAATLGYTDVLRILLSRGARPNPPGPRGITPLQAAAAEGHVAVVKLLLDKGSPIDERSDHHGTALMAAASRGRLAVLRMLLKFRADPNAVGGQYGNALQAAAVVGNTDIATVLLKSHADINALGSGEATALQAASFAGNAKMVKLLLAKGADVAPSKGAYGSALDAAQKFGHWEIYKMLMEHGATVGPESTSAGAVAAAEAKIGIALEHPGSDAAKSTFAPQTLEINTVSSDFRMDHSDFQPYVLSSQS